MRLHVSIENNAGAFIACHRVRIEVGDLVLAGGDDGKATLNPPASILVENADGYWLTEPQVSGGQYAGAWEGRRVRISLERANLAAETLGTFRIAPEAGFQLRGDGWGTLKLVAMAEDLKTGDAADVGLGLGHYVNVPWPRAVDLLRSPEDSSTLALPDAAIPYEERRRACSTIGRPGDERSDGWHEMNDRAVGMVYNESAAKWAALCLSGAIYEYDRTSGLWSTVTVAYSIPSVTDAVSIWWHRTSSGNGYYIVLAALASGDAHYYDPRRTASKLTAAFLYRHDQAAPLYYLPDLLVTPCVIRDPSRPKPSSAIPDADTSVIYGNEWYSFDGGGGEAIKYRREAVAIPFDQAAFPLESRDTAFNDQIDTLDVWRPRVGGGWSGVPLNAFTRDDSNYWRVSPNDAVTPAQRFRDDELRTGAGPHVFRLGDAEAGWSWTDPDTEYVSLKTGLRHALGQGPLVDLSHEHSGSAAWDNKHWLAAVSYVAGYGWRVVALLFDGSTFHTQTVATLGMHKLPTFVTCDITRPNDDTGQRGAVIVGWIDYDPDGDEQLVGPNDTTTGSCQMARSGLDVYPIDTASSTAAPTFSPLGGTVLHFREGDAGDTISRVYRDGSHPHISGRWTPVAMGFRRYQQAGDGHYYTRYAAALSCLDRSELGPANNGGDSVETDRSGDARYRLLYVKITIQATSATDPYPYATSVTDTYGPGYDVQHKSPLPWMGLTRVLQGDELDEGTGNLVADVYGYNPADQGLYRLPLNDTDRGRPVFVGAVPLADLWLGLGTLAVGNEDGDRTKPVVGGLSHPVFPCSGATTWPAGQYQAWLYDSKHSGRIRVLDTEGLTKLDAIALATQLANGLFYLDRDGTAQLVPYPAADDASEITITDSDFALDGASRSDTAIVNSFERSVYDALPGEKSETIIRTPGSRFAASVVFNPTGIYPVELELRCISSGRPTDDVDEDADPLRAHVLWAFRLVSRRITTALSSAAASGVSTVYVGQLTDVDEGDLVTLGPDDLDLVVTNVLPDFGALQLATALSDSYAAAAAVRIDKAATGQWSHSLRLDADAGVYRGVAALAAAASAGDRTLKVTSAMPFARGSFVRIHSQAGTDVENYPGTYLVERVRRREDTGAAYHEIDVRNLEDGAGLVEAVAAGDPLTVLLNVPPIGLSQRVGQTGATFGLVATPGSVEDNTEPPISEGDLVRLSYAGEVAKKNEHNRRSSSDPDSIASYGEQKALRRAPNRFMDGELALLDCQRIVRRGADPRAILTLPGVRMLRDADQAALLTLGLWAKVTVRSYRLLQDKSDYSIDALVRRHCFHPSTGLVDLEVIELDSSTPGGRLAGVDKVPGVVDLRTEADDGEVLLWWDHPVESDFESVMVRYSTTDYPKDPTDGTLLGTYNDGTHAAKHTSLSNGVTVYYSAFTIDEGGNKSAPAHACATPATDPAAVTNLAATDADQQVTLSWTDPAAADFAGVIVRYRTDGTYPTSATDGTAAGFVAPGAEGLAVTELDNGRAYSFAAFAVDVTGNVAAAATVTGEPDFDPADYVSVSANWRAHDLRDVGDGNPIDALPDASGNGHDLAKYADLNRPTLVLSDADYNDLPVIDFDPSGAAQTLRGGQWNTDGWKDLLSNADGGMVIVVGEAGTTGSSQCFLSVYSSHTVFYIRGKYCVFYEAKTGSPFALATDASLAVSTPTTLAFAWKPSRFFEVLHNGAAESNDNGDAVADTDDTADAYFHLGSTQSTGNPLNGRIAQVIIADAYDLPGLEHLIERLREKYGHYDNDFTGGAFTNGFSPGFPVNYPAFTNGFSSGFNAED